MADKNNNVNQVEENEEPVVITLTDDETGEEQNFEILADEVVDGVRYFALIPAEDDDGEEYLILKVTEDGDDFILETIDDDDVFEKVEEYFNDLFFGEVDYDEN